jgi:hypothetical protein
VVRFILFFLIFGHSLAFGQSVRGIVKDGEKYQPLAHVFIKTQDSKVLAQTDANGAFDFQLDPSIKTLYFSAVGFETAAIELDGKFLEIILSEKITSLAEIKITKKKYRNKGNPAVELIRKVIENKSSNRNSGYNFLNYKEHEKVRIGLINTRERLLKTPVLKLFPALERNFDSTRFEGKVLLPLYVQELLNEYHVTPEKQIKSLLKEKKVSLDENLFDNEGIRMYIQHAYQDFDIYDNNLMVITNQFISPISDIAPTFYMYDILDTVTVNGHKEVKMLITPRNSTDFLFWGDMRVSLDSYAVTDINLRVGKGMNLNWIRNLEISQQFFKNSEEKYSLEDNRVMMEFSITQKMKESIFTERLVSYTDYKINEPFDFKKIELTKEPEKAGIDTELGKNSEYDDNIHATLDSLKNTRRFKNISNAVGVLGYGYFNASKYFEVGPLGSFLGFNQLEGYRVRVGARTMPAFSDKVFFEGFGAYGFRDQKWKYNGALTYSFTGKNKYIFPMKNITLSYRSDVEIPGNNLRYTADYSFLLNIARGETDKWMYYKRLTLRYVQEFQNRLSYRIGVERTLHDPAGSLVYVRAGETLPIRDLVTSEVKGELRFAPKERFYQGKSGRSSLTTQYPIFTLRGSAAIKGFMGGQYTFQKLSLNIDKRFLLSPIGFTDATFEVGGTFGKSIPFPFLDIMRANQTYTFQEDSYNMMNFMEFVADRFIAAKLEHNFNGAILNKVPLISKLKFREFLTFKVLYGGLSSSNMPNSSNELFTFPVNKEGTQSTYSLNQVPYMEGSVGLGNILRLFRIDFVKRFTYLKHPNIPSTGVRIRVDIDF